MTIVHRRRRLHYPLDSHSRVLVDGLSQLQEDYLLCFRRLGEILFVLFLWSNGL
jgi:hypothetical protein